MNLLDTLKKALAVMEDISHQGPRFSKAKRDLRAAIAELEKAEPVKYTTGHCKEKAHPKGCQLHNLHCGYPDCDRKPIPAPAVPEEQWITELRYELMKSKMTHNFTFSRNEVIALLNAAPKGETL